MKKFIKKIIFSIDNSLQSLKKILILYLRKWSFFKNNEKLIFNFSEKYLLPIIPSLLITIFIFYFMSLLIFQKNILKKDNIENSSIQFLMNKEIDDLELRSRLIPKKPEEPKTKPSKPSIKIQSQSLKKPKLESQLPKLQIDKNFISDPTKDGVSISNSSDQSVIPLVRIEPLYPRKAALQGVEGFVILKFDINSSGMVDNISVLQASPPQIFNRSAVQALKKWKYKAKIMNGKTVRQKALKVQLDFKLEK